MELTGGWEVAPTPPGRFAAPGELQGVEWRAARVPGTAAAAVGADGRDFDAEDWWFRCRFAPPPDIAGQVALELDGIATLAEVFVNGELVLESTSMWQRHEVDLTGRLSVDNELAICCRALAPVLSRRRRPSSRWRTRTVNAGNLRWHRTMIFGRSPGFAPQPAAVGPWRPIRLVAGHERRLALLGIRSHLEGDDGRVLVTGRVLDQGAVSPSVSLLGQRVRLQPGEDGLVRAEVHVPRVARWWPHTHGSPTLHELVLELDGEPVMTRRVGFRDLSWSPEIAEAGLELRVNGVPLFARGAVWTPPDLIGMAPGAEELRRLLERVRDAGMNMLRIPGTAAYESPRFHDLCDELGILVWQDLMFANLDYPVGDPDFRATVLGEARELLAELGGRPSLAVVCGNSEVEQQPAMMGLDPALGRDSLWDVELSELVADSGAGCAYIRSTPCGGTLPFHADRGVTHYFGVTGYFQPPEDARRAAVRFASECLAIANVPDEVEFPVHHPQWKAGVQRDAGTGWGLGAGWDFDDVRDHYLKLLYGLDPVALRRSDLGRYLELSRAVSGELMAELMGEWRREGSPCRGALVLWLKDMLPGAGLGVFDHRGQPKVALHHLRRALLPVAVWTTDEGVSGVAIHIANDRPEPLRAELRVALYRDLEIPVAEVTQPVEVPGHGTAERTVEGVIGRFVDAAWSYRFGPPAQDAIFVTLASGPEPEQMLSQTVRFPAGRPARREGAAQLGLEVSSRGAASGAPELVLRSQRVVHGVRLTTPGFEPQDDAFTLEPGHERVVGLRGGATEGLAGATASALNLEGEVRIPGPQAGQ